MEAIVGRDGMAPHDAVYLDFADAFEKRFIGQGESRRPINQSLDDGSGLLREFGLYEE